MFPTQRKLTNNATITYDCFPGLLTRGAPSKFYPGTDPTPHSSVCWQVFSGTDPITGFAPPTASPLFGAQNGPFIGGYGIYLIDGSHPLPTADQAGFDSVIGVGTETVNYRGVDMTALTMNHYNHVSAGFVSNVQSHFMIQCNTSAVGWQDLSEFCVEVVMSVPDQNNDLDTTYRFRVIHDYKTVSDYRYVVFIVKANSSQASEFGVALGTLGWCFVADNQQSGLPANEEYIRMYNFEVEVPPGDEMFSSKVYWKRSASHADLETHRFKHIVTSKKYGEQTVFDVNPDTLATWNIAHPLSCILNGDGVPTNCRNVGMGPNPDSFYRQFNRLFLVSNYHGGKAGVDVKSKVARVRIGNGLF